MHSNSQAAEAHLRSLYWFVHQRNNQRQYTRQSTPSSWNCNSRRQTQIATSIAGQIATEGGAGYLRKAAVNNRLGRKPKEQPTFFERNEQIQLLFISDLAPRLFYNRVAISTNVARM